MKTVTYCGPDDPQDPTTRYITADGEHRLPKGVAVEVPDDIASQLGDVEGHTFEVAAAKKAAAKKTDKAETAATEED